MAKRTKDAVKQRFQQVVTPESGEDYDELIKPEKARKKLTKHITNALYIPLNLITPDPQQPRKKFEPQALQELAQSIVEHGVLQTITVTRDQAEPGKFVIITGERRHRAAQIAGLQEMPCIVLDNIGEVSKTAKQLIENIQREDLTPPEKADGLLKLKENLGEAATWESVEKLTGFGKRRRRQILAVKNLPEEIQQEMITLGTRRTKGKITEGHARALLRLANKKQQLALFEQIKQEGLTADEAMKLAQQMLGKKKPKSGPSHRLLITANSLEELISKLKSKLKEKQKELEKKVSHTQDLSKTEQAAIAETKKAFKGKIKFISGKNE